MNILDTFYFMFEADATKVAKGAAAGETASIKLKKVIDDTDASADALGKNFVKLAKTAA